MKQREEPVQRPRDRSIPCVNEDHQEGGGVQREDHQPMRSQGGEELLLCLW